MRVVLGRILSKPLRVTAIILVVLIAWFLIALFQPLHGEGEGEASVTIPKGASVSEIASILDDKGVISSGTLFEIRVTLAGKRSELYPGTYVLASGMSYGDAIEALGDPPSKRTIKVTIPEGLSRPRIASRLRDHGLLGRYLRATVSSPELDPADYGGRKARNLEGFLFPATYELPAKGAVNDLVGRQLDAFREQIPNVDLTFARSKNLNIYDVLTIASMIEAEVSVPEERELVAAVIYNRLKQGIRLGIDATVRFAVNNYDSPLTLSELDSDSPYNTRKFFGLPPGPIGNPGIASIEAAANPADVNYLFFVVKPGTCGEHAFSSTNAEFLRDQAEYNAARDAAGGSPVEC